MSPTFKDMKATHWKRDRGEKFQTIAQGNAAVKIYRRARGKGKTRRLIFEVVDYTRGPGLRRLRGFGDYSDALAAAEHIADQLATGKATAAAMLDTEAASYGRALELLRPTGASLEAAASDYARAFELVGNAVVEAAQFYRRHGADQVTRRTVAEVVTELVESKKARAKSARYIGDLSARLARFANDFSVDIGNVTTADVQRWLDGLKVAPRTAKNFRRVLYTLFGFAESHGYLAKGANPVEDTERIDANGGAIEIYTPEEIAALLKAAPENYLPYVALGAFAGLRSAEIERLEWKGIDLPGGYIHIAAGQAKTAQRRLVPLLPNLAQWLAPYAKQRGKVWKGTIYDLQEARAAAVKAAGVPWKANALRHSFISYRVADVQDVAKVALEAGNSPQIIFHNYRELVKPEAAKTWFAIAPDQPANVVTLKTEAAI